MKLAFLLFLGMLFAQGAIGRHASRVARSPELILETKVNPEDQPCDSYDTPCGWAVYVRPSRDVDTYVYNCKCKSDELCTKTQDDISIKAFVYRCRPDDTLFNSTSTTSTTTQVTPVQI